MSDVIITASDASLETLLNNSDTPILLDLWAPWCQPCKALAPLLETLAENADQQLTVAKLDVEQYPAVMRRFGVRSIPTLLLFRNGEEVSRQIGMKTLAQLRGWLASHQIALEQHAPPTANASLRWGAFYGDPSLHEFLFQRLRRHAAEGRIEKAFSPYWLDNKGTTSAALAHSAQIEVFERVTGLPAAIACLLENLPAATPAQVDALANALLPGKDVGDVPLRWLHMWLGDSFYPWTEWLAEPALDDLRRQWLEHAGRHLAGAPAEETAWAALHQQATALLQNADSGQELEKYIAALLALLSPSPDAADAQSWRAIAIQLGFALAQLVQIQAGWSHAERAIPAQRVAWFKAREAAAGGNQLTDKQIVELRARWLEENPQFSAKEEAFYRHYPSHLATLRAPLEEQWWSLLHNAPRFRAPLE
ncbi:thioredoxin [Brenneria corticis]|uniref:Thioredoxin n=1 Tax=Brenneria corticis TaxID=2173106 RepID=A0A2U1U916_9GAMM|nr:thioredoxin [Brenneria sp. CFCC 11842]PWC18166.1 thioredoxin [Brenneria sp. CFCC 11842]